MAKELNLKTKFPLKTGCLLLSLLLFVTILRADNNPISIPFTLKSAAITSAGIYKRDGTLIRTLWNNVQYKAGQHTYLWDGTDDLGKLVQDTGYFFKLISGKFVYTWEGTIGNNSDSMTGSSKIRAFERFTCMAASGNYAYYGIGYSEGVPSCYKLDLRKPANKINILFSDKNDIDQECTHVATDGTLVYWGGYDPYNPALSFVYATKTKDDLEHTFSAGTSYATTYGRTYASTIDLTIDNSSALISGMAVQNNGNFLFVSHKLLNHIRVIDKTSGELKHTIYSNLPGELCIDGRNQLWVIGGDGFVRKLNILSDGNLQNSNDSITTLNEPLAISTNLSGNKLYVLDGAASQQIKTFDLNGKLIATLGQKGGYIFDPKVENNKFYFSDSSTGLSKPFIACMPDGSIRVGDVGNERVMHFDSNFNYLDHIMCLPHSYSISVDKNNPERVFNQFLEFKIDYSLPLAPNNGSWTLVKNWRRYIPSNYFQKDMLGIFRQMTTLSNGSAYCILDRFENGIRKPEIIELPQNGPLRFTGITLNDFAIDIITSEGGLRRLLTSRNVGDSGYWETQSLNRIDANGNPIWDQALISTRLPVIKIKDPAFSHVASAAITSGGYNVVFNAEKENTGFHLGAVKTGTNQWAWKTSLATHKDYTGPMPKDGRFDIGNGVVYPGGDVYALDQNIFWNYHGEFWKNSQTNIWNHFHECGLMLGQFGVTSPEASADQKEAFAKGAGNVFSSALIKLGDVYYLYHNDESVHGGVHRWKISGLNTVQIQNIEIEKPSQIKNGLKGSFFKSKDWDPIFKFTETIQSNERGLTTKLTGIQSDIKTARWSGYLNFPESDRYSLKILTNSGYRFFISDTLVKIDENNNLNDSFNLLDGNFEANSSLKLRLESFDGNATLLYSKNGSVFKRIPDEWLKPEEFDSELGINLMEGVFKSNQPENDHYGWKGNLGKKYSVFDVKSGIKSNGNDMDLSFQFTSEDSSFEVYRNLKGFVPCNNWSLSGNLDYSGNFPDYSSNGIDLVLKDTNDKTIFIIKNELLMLEEYGYPTKITFNGDDLVNRPYAKMYDLISNPQTFNIEFNSGRITFKLGSLIALTAGPYESGADMNAPGKLSIQFKGATPVSGKAISVSNLKLFGSKKLPVSIDGQLKFCMGDSVELQSPYSSDNLWTYGITTKVNVVKNTQKLVLKHNSSNCIQTSDSIEIMAIELPNVNIYKRSDTLYTEYRGKNIWYLNQSEIQNNGNRFHVIKSIGSYTVRGIDSNGCERLSDEYKIDIVDIDEIHEDFILIYPNPCQGIFTLINQGVWEATFKIMDILGNDIESGKIEVNNSV
ncbi:MAG TPA: PA14 domain-containing protein, partial [Bacteroidia bacterium]